MYSLITTCSSTSATSLCWACHCKCRTWVRRSAAMPALCSRPLSPLLRPPTLSGTPPAAWTTPLTCRAVQVLSCLCFMPFLCQLPFDFASCPACLLTLPVALHAFPLPPAFWLYLLPMLHSLGRLLPSHGLPSPRETQVGCILFYSSTGELLVPAYAAYSCLCCCQLLAYHCAEKLSCATWPKALRTSTPTLCQCLLFPKASVITCMFASHYNVCMLCIPKTLLLQLHPAQFCNHSAQIAQSTAVQMPRAYPHKKHQPSKRKRLRRLTALMQRQVLKASVRAFWRYADLLRV